MKHKIKGLSLVLLFAFILELVIPFVPLMDNLRTAEAAPDFGNASIQPYPVANKRYAVGFMYYEAWSNTKGRFTSFGPGDIVPPDLLYHTYNFSFPNRTVTDVKVYKFNTANNDHINYFNQSRVGQNYNVFKLYLSESVNNPQVSNSSGKGTSTVTFTVNLSGELTTGRHQDMTNSAYCSEEVTVKGKKQKRCAPGTKVYRYYFPVVFEFHLNGRMITQHYTTDSKSLASVFPTDTKDIVIGKMYEEKPSSHKDYKYEGYKESSEGDPTGDIKKGTPNIYYNGKYDTHRIYFYYSKLEEPPPPGSGEIKIRHMNRVGSTGAYTLAGEESETVARVPATRTATAKASYGDIQGYSLSFTGYSNTVTNSTDNTRAVSLTTTNKTAYVTFFYNKPDNSGRYTVDFKIDPSSISYRDSFSFTPKITVSGCTYISHKYRIERDGSRVVTSAVQGMSTVSNYTYSTYPWIIGIGTHQVYVQLTTSCGISEWVGPKTLEVAGPKNNRPPVFQAAFVYPFAPTVPIYEVVEGTVMNMIYIYDPSVPTPYDPDGDSTYFDGFDFDSTSSPFLKQIPTVYEDHKNMDGYHNIVMDTPGDYAITASMRDEFGAKATSVARIKVVPNNPIPRIVAPAEVIVNRPIKADAIHGQGSTAALQKTIRDYHWTNKKDRYTQIGTEIVELEVTDSAGVRSLPKDKATAAINVVPDKPPVAKLELPERMLRGSIDVLNKSYSPDNDGIVVSNLTIWYDADHSGAFTKEPGKKLPIGVKGSYKFTPDKVGKYRFQIYIEEDWGLSDTATYEVEVVNEAPTTAFSLSSESPEPPQFDISQVIPASILFTNEWTTSSLTQPSGLSKLNDLYLTYDVKTNSLANRHGKSPYKAPPADSAITSETKQEAYNGSSKPLFDTPYLHKGASGSSRQSQGIFGSIPYQRLRTNSDLITPYWSGEQWKKTELSEYSAFLYQDVFGGTYDLACRYYDWDSDDVKWKCTLTRTELNGKKSWAYENSAAYSSSSITNVPFGVGRGSNNGVVLNEDGTKIGFQELVQYGSSYQWTTRWYDIKTLKPVTAVVAKPVQLSQGSDVDAETIQDKNSKGNYRSTTKYVVYEDENVTVKRINVTEDSDWYSSSDTRTLSEMLESYNKQSGQTTTYTVYDKKVFRNSWSDGSCSPWNGGSSYSRYTYQEVKYATSQDGITYIVDSFNKIHVVDKYGKLVKTVTTFSQYPDRTRNCSGGDTDTREFGIMDYGFGADGEFYAVLDEKYTELRYRQEGQSKFPYYTSRSYVKQTLYSSKGMVTAQTNTDELGQVLHTDTVMADADFNFEFQQSIAVSTHPSGFAFRARDNQNMYRLELTNSKAELVKMVGGKRTSLGSASINVQGDRFLHIKLSVRGDKIKVRSEGLPLFDVTDKTFKEGSYGYFFNAPGTKFRNLQTAVPIMDENQIHDVGIVGEQLTYTSMFEDVEGDPQVEPLDEWRYVHSQPDKFLDAKDGHSGLSKHHEKVYTEPLLELDRVGQYMISYSAVDNPTPKGYRYPGSSVFAAYMQRSDAYSRTFIVHRKPIALFTILQDDNFVLTYTDRSYDPDRWLPGGTCSQEDTGIDYCKTRGITGHKWAYIDPDGKTYNSKLGRPTKKGLYTVRLSVKDEYAAWSEWYEQEIWLDAPLANTPPVPGFTTTPITTYRDTDVVIASQAYDLEDGDRTTLEHAYYMRNVTADGSESLQSASRTTWTRSFSTIGTFAIRQVVKDSQGLSAEMTKQVYVVNRKPQADIQVPESSDQSSPTKFDVLRPTFEWTFQDADKADKQTQYQVRIYKYGGVLLLDNGERIGASGKWIPSVDLPEQVKLYIQVRVHDGIEWGEWSERKFFYVETNRPPVAHFVCTPNPAYEGDRVECVNGSTDPDDDELTYQWTITGPGGYRQTDTSENLSIPGSVTDQRTGKYQVRLRVTDAKGAPNETDATGTLEVLPLGLTAQVSHTPEWETYRHNWNKANPKAERGEDTFWAGEGFVLTAYPNLTDASGGSQTRAMKVSVEAAGIGNAELKEQSGISAIGAWKGYIGSKEAKVPLEGLPDGAYTFLFKVAYSNGVFRSAAVEIRIVGHWGEVIRIHRRY